jgi:hypothetical protein
MHTESSDWKRVIVIVFIIIVISLELDGLRIGEYAAVTSQRKGCCAKKGLGVTSQLHR